MSSSRQAIAFAPSELRGIQPLPRGRGCDFCATGARTWRHAARDIDLGTIVHDDYVLQPVSLGAWHACSDCDELIEAGDWPALARRALRTLGLDLTRSGPGTRVKLLSMLHAAHERFRTARTGLRTAVA